jgi:ubiquitin-protein ligase E3 C
MFPTFSGNSRRPRNVNLSGQKNTNPFAASGWTPSTPTTSKTVAEAQAVRLQRQQGRERVKAAQEIQRAWRGHKERRDLRLSRRETFDALYGSSGGSESLERLRVAFPLILAFFDGRDKSDIERLVVFAQDLGRHNLQELVSDQLPPQRLDRLLQIAIASLQRYSNLPNWAAETKSNC